LTKCNIYSYIYIINQSQNNETLNTMKISVPENPVITQVFHISGGRAKVQYSIDVMNDNVWDEETTVTVYSINGVPGTLEGAKGEELNVLIRDHVANVHKEFDLANCYPCANCGREAKYGMFCSTSCEMDIVG
jgi:hypothetical protein